MREAQINTNLFFFFGKQSLMFEQLDKQEEVGRYYSVLQIEQNV